MQGGEKFDKGAVMTENIQSSLFRERLRKLAFLPWDLWAKGRSYAHNVLATVASIIIYILVYGAVIVFTISPFVVTEMWWLAIAVAVVMSILARGKLRANIDRPFWVGVLVVCGVYALAKPIGVYVISNRTIDLVIRDSERVSDEKNGWHYRLTTSVDTYKIVDSNWFFQWKSSNLHGYAKANVGKNCRVRVYGIRFAYLSMFPTVTSIQCNAQ